MLWQGQPTAPLLAMATRQLGALGPGRSPSSLAPPPRRHPRIPCRWSAPPATQVCLSSRSLMSERRRSNGGSPTFDISATSGRARGERRSASAQVGPPARVRPGAAANSRRWRRSSSERGSGQLAGGAASSSGARSSRAAAAAPAGRSTRRSSASCASLPRVGAERLRAAAAGAAEGGARNLGDARPVRA